MYDLRNRSVTPQQSHNYSSGDMPSENKNMKVVLTRMPILENPVNHNCVFEVQNEKVMIKKNSPRCRDKNIICLVFISFFITILLVMHYRDECHTYGSHVARRFVVLPNKFRFVNTYVMNTLYAKWSQRFGQNRFGSALKSRKKPHRVKRKSKVCYNDIRDFINKIWFKEREIERMAEGKTLSFIEEQCRLQNVVPKVADYVQYSMNDTGTGFDVNSLTDYASLDRGARILSTSRVEPYVEYKVQSGILRYIFGIKYFNIDELSICRLSTTLCRYFVAGPSSLLTPWSKAGECWSFKGTHGSVQIELTERIYITAVSVEHITSSLASSGNIRSAPAQFSIVGVDDSGGYKFTSRNHLGTYKYLLGVPNIQTFTLSPEDSNYPYKIVEFNVESNHGNENYTCVYRLRVHGRPITSLQN